MNQERSKNAMAPPAGSDTASTDEVDRAVRQSIHDIQRQRFLTLSRQRPRKAAQSSEFPWQARWRNAAGQACESLVRTTAMGSQSALEFASGAPQVRLLGAVELLTAPLQFPPIRRRVSVVDSEPDGPQQRSTGLAATFELAADSGTTQGESIELEAQIGWTNGGQTLKVIVPNAEECGLDVDTLWGVAEVKGIWDEHVGFETRSVAVELKRDGKERLVDRVELARPRSTSGYVTVTLRSFTAADMWLLDGTTDDEEELSQATRFLAEHDVRVRRCRDLSQLIEAGQGAETVTLQIVDEPVKREAASADARPFLALDETLPLLEWFYKDGVDAALATRAALAWIAFQPKAMAMLTRSLLARQRGRREDLLHDTLLKIHKALIEGRFRSGNLEAFFTTVLKNCMIDWHRRTTGSGRRGRVHEVYGDSLPDGEDTSDRSEEAVALSLAEQTQSWLDGYVTQLNRKEQLFWYLTAIEGLAGRELAEQLSLSPEGSALKELRQKVKIKLLLCGALDRLQGRCGQPLDGPRPAQLPEAEEQAVRLKHVRGWNWPAVEAEVGWSKSERLSRMPDAEPRAFSQAAIIGMVVDDEFDERQFDFAEAWLIHEVDDDRLMNLFDCDQESLDSEKRDIGSRLHDWMRRKKIDRYCRVPSQYR